MLLTRNLYSLHRCLTTIRHTISSVQLASVMSNLMGTLPGGTLPGAGRR